MSFRVFCPKLAEKWPLKWAQVNSKKFHFCQITTPPYLWPQDLNNRQKQKKLKIGWSIVDVVTIKKRGYKDAAHSTAEVHGAWPWFNVIFSTLICDNHVIDNAAVFMTCWTRSARMTWRLCVYIACSLEIPINRNKAIMKWKRGITQQTRYAFTCANVENKKVQGVFFTGPALKALSMELGPPKNREWLVLPNRLRTADWLIESM